MSSYSKRHSLAEVLLALSMTVAVSHFKTCSDRGLPRIQLVIKNRFLLWRQGEDWRGKCRIMELPNFCSRP